MISPGNVSLAFLLLGPIAWRKVQAWRQEKARASSSNIRQQPPFSLPRPFLLPSNLFRSFAFLLLLYLHLAYLFHPAKILARSDVFLLTKTNVHASVATIRSKVASMTFEELGWNVEWGEEGLETLLRRLSSFEGRQLHLMIGTTPFLSCHFCSTSKDYQLFSIVDHLWQFSVNLVLFGILTIRSDSLEVLDEVVFSILQMITGKDLRKAFSRRAQEKRDYLRPDGYGYRVPMLYLLGSFALAQVAVHTALFEMSFGQGKWDHWYANYSIAFHCALLGLSLVVYLGQRVPKVPAMLEIFHLIRQSRQHTDRTLAHVQALHLTSQVMWGDVGLRQRASSWFDERKETLDQLTSDETMNRLYSRAIKAGVDVPAHQEASRHSAKQVWKGAQPRVQEWHSAFSSVQAVESSPEPITPLAPSLGP